MATIKTKNAEETSKVTSKVASKVSGDLEEAANNAIIALVPSFGQKYSDGSYVSSCRDCFNREELIELFKAGVKWQKEQMMAKAVDAIAQRYDAELWLNSQNDLKEFAEGEEVKVIVIKKDEL